MTISQIKRKSFNKIHVISSKWSTYGKKNLSVLDPDLILSQKRITKQTSLYNEGIPGLRKESNQSRPRESSLSLQKENIQSLHKRNTTLFHLNTKNHKIKVNPNAIVKMIAIAKKNQGAEAKIAQNLNVIMIIMANTKKDMKKRATIIMQKKTNTVLNKCSNQTVLNR